MNTTYYVRHKKLCKANAKSYYKKNRESILEKKRAYRKTRVEHIKAYNHEYYLRVTKIKRNLTKNS